MTHEPITTTLKQIKAHSPCIDGWKKLLNSLGKTRADNKPLTFSYIAESNGIDDALWCLRSLPENYRPKIRLLAADYAERVLHLYEKQYLNDNRPANAIKAARDFANGEITRGQLEVARNAAWAAGAATWDAAGAAGAAEAARAAAEAAAWAAWDAAGAADWAAAWAAAEAAGAAAEAVGAAERTIQKELLIKYFG